MQKLKRYNLKISVLIPDAEDNLIYPVIHCFSKIKEIEIYLISNIKNKHIKHSRFIKHFSYYPNLDNEKEWILRVNDEVHKYNINLVMPIFEEGVRKLAKNIELINFKDKICLLPSYSNFKTALNKNALSIHMINNGLSSPINFRMNESNIKNTKFSFPVLAKPDEGFGGGNGIKKILNFEELESFYNDKTKVAENYLIEEFIEGYDYSFAVLCKNGEILAYTMQKGILFGDGLYSPPVGVEFLFDSKLLNEIKNLMKSLEWSGVANIDIRYDLKAKNFKILEINPRFWGSLEASLAAGVNFPYIYCLASLGRRIENQEYQFIKYLKVAALKRGLKEGIFGFFNFNFIFKNTPIMYMIKDPMPNLFKYSEIISENIKALLHKKIRFN